MLSFGFSDGEEGLMIGVGDVMNAGGDLLIFEWAEDFEGSNVVPDGLEAPREDAAFDAPHVFVFEGLQDLLVGWVSVIGFQIFLFGS